jgi:predicted ferric reductase
LKLAAASFDFKSFQPGSYALICIPNLDPSWHPFSIASPPGSKTVTFHIKAMAKGSWTQRLHDIARNGDKSKNLKVFMYGPYGSLTVKLDQSVNIVMFAGGIGITPFLSIFSHL